MASRGRTAGAPAMRGGATDNKPRRTVVASDVRAVYQRRLEELVTKATDAFRDVVRGAEVSDQTSNARAEFQTRVDAAGLAQAAEGLLRLISEIKVAAIVQDANATTNEAEHVRTALRAHADASAAELRQLRDDVGDLLEKLETHYYQSQCGVVTTRAPSQETGR